MSEQGTRSPEAAVDYRGKRLRVMEVMADPYGNNIHGFMVTAEGIRSEFANAVVYEGMYLGGAGSEDGPAIENDMLALSNVTNRSPEKGLGSLLTRFALEEGERRGFTSARLVIHNPQIVKILEKLREEEDGPVARATYFEDYPELKMYRSTARLVADTKQITPQEAIDYLASFPAEEGGFVDHARVDCILDLRSK